MANWQLSAPSHLTPDTYSLGWRFDPVTRQRYRANISSDIFCHYNTPVLNTWHLGFGDQCFICDKMVKSINLELSQQSTGIAKRYTKRFSKNIRPKLYRMISKWNPFQTLGLHQTADPSVCNPGCIPQPLPPSYTSNENGRRQLKAYRNEWNLNLYLPMLISDFVINGMVRLFNGFAFCSAYVTSMSNSINSTSLNYRLATRNIPKLYKYEKLVNYFRNFLVNISPK